MRLISFEQHGRVGTGLVDPSGRTVSRLCAADGTSPTMLDLVRSAGAPASVAAEPQDATPIEDVTVLAPFPSLLRNIICVGKNYRAHAAEFEASGFDSSSQSEVVPQFPVFFTKGSNTVIADGAPIPASSDTTNSVDYEGELCVVVGRKGRNIAPGQALDHVFGYTLINDVTSRVLQGQHKQWFLGKNLDGFCPMGPALVTRDEIPDVEALRLTTHVNGELRQSAALSDLLFDIPTLIATLSAQITLEPGDIIATGTPQGVGIGFKPPRYLRPGDTVTIRVDGIGTLSNPVR
ncbi:fumarylacetoacetate hydrolase family protein [Xanthobacter pseudotagetidis]|uniref:fumarylacetoacetate hydrolase family protein n=1 Tax=Xanthobacter pseudotagetidis TaxID=3119911 RepID=UPI00372B8AE5